MAETVFLVRHGEAESNVQRYFGGWGDSPLTRLGRVQAKLLRRRLAKEKIGRVFCSDLVRARQTAELLSLNCPITYSRALREKSYGKLEGVNWNQDEKKYERYHVDAYARAPGGENCPDVQRRVVSYVSSRVLAAREEKVLIVSHHGPLVLLACHLLGMPVKNWRKLRLGNCGLCILDREGGLWRLKLWNSLSHYGLLNFSPLLSRESKPGKSPAGPEAFNTLGPKEVRVMPMAQAARKGRKKWWYDIGAMAIACIFFLAVDLATTRSISWSIWPIGAILFFGIAYQLLNRFGRE